MIASLTGELRHVDESSVELAAGPMTFEVLIPASDSEPLRSQIGTPLTFFTLVYLEGDPNRGNLEPRVIGFLRRDDREFFELFTTVKGIGPKTALRALTEPIAHIAAAIESRDPRALTKLNGIGKRTAELMVAQLAGKCAKFAIAGTIVDQAKSPRPSIRRAPAEEDALAAMIQLGERRGDAEQLLDRAKALNASLTDTNDLVREMLRLRTSR